MPEAIRLSRLHYWVYTATLRCAVEPTGLWLFSVKPGEYFVNLAFRWKALLLSIALANVILQHRKGIAGAIERALAARISAALSLCVWVSVLVTGRWIGFL